LEREVKKQAGWKSIKEAMVLTGLQSHPRRGGRRRRKKSGRRRRKRRRRSLVFATNIRNIQY